MGYKIDQTLIEYQIKKLKCMHWTEKIATLDMIKEKIVITKY